MKGNYDIRTTVLPAHKVEDLALIHYGTSRYDKSRFQPITGLSLVCNKPIGGFWCRWRTDFLAIAKSGIDALWLTVRGERATRYTTPGLYGWDCECVLIMNPGCFYLL